MTESRPGDAGGSIAVRPFAEEDRPAFAAMAPRLHPGPTPAARDPEVFRAYFDRLGSGEIPFDWGWQTFVAVDVAQTPLGLLAIGADRDHFTGHRRAYVHVLVVAAEAEGRGVGQALMRFAEAWGRERGMKEIVLDVFAGNERAIAFYERFGFRRDHLRMAKPL